MKKLITLTLFMVFTISANAGSYPWVQDEKWGSIDGYSSGKWTEEQKQRIIAADKKTEKYKNIGYPSDKTPTILQDRLMTNEVYNIVNYCNAVFTGYRSYSLMELRSERDAEKLATHVKNAELFYNLNKLFSEILYHSFNEYDVSKQIHHSEVMIGDVRSCVKQGTLMMNNSNNPQFYKMFRGDKVTSEDAPEELDYEETYH